MESVLSRNVWLPPLPTLRLHGHSPPEISIPAEMSGLYRSLGHLHVAGIALFPSGGDVTLVLSHTEYGGSLLDSVRHTTLCLFLVTVYSPVSVVNGGHLLWIVSHWILR